MIRFVEQVASTNAELAARLANGEPVGEGEWLVADRQSAGRGRSGRTWHDGAGNFMGSTVVRPVRGDPLPFTLALVAGLSVYAAILDHVDLQTNRSMLGLASARSPEIGVTLKWPNDLLVGNAKLAGILLESHDDAVVVGIGVNLVVAPSIDRRETIALAQLGIGPDRDRFAQDLARLFALDLQRWRDFGLSAIIARWSAAAHPHGTPLVADAPGGAISGGFAGLADDGALRLRLADGSVREIHAGEVRLPAELRG